MFDGIKDKLNRLEEDSKIKVLYACESGSRAWGFPSHDSDFDVRFIYVRAPEAYLSIHDAADVIDLPINDVLDIGGWDIRKALKLFLKSNGPLLEWLQSPIVYKNDSGFDSELRHLMLKYFSARACGNHYLSMALNTVNNDLQTDQVKLKRYFYALRSAMACKWITEKQSVPPMEFGMLRVLNDDQSFQSVIDGLLKIKCDSNEKTLVEHVEILDNWLELTLSQCKMLVEKLPSNHQPPDELNDLFRKYIL